MHRLASAVRRPSASTLTAAAAALLAGGLFLSGSPAPAAHGPVPADAPAPSSPTPVPSGPLLARPSVDPLATKSGAGPAIAMPGDLVGAWYTGNVGGIGYVEPNTGSYTEGRSEGVAYTFYPDGTWQYGYLVNSSLYSCTMRIEVFRQGILAAVDETAHTADLDTRLAQMHSEDSCVTAYNYDKDLPADDETLIWTRTTDEYGDVLLLRGPTTDVSVFRPAQAP